MDFFARQRQARLRSRYLLVLFGGLIVLAAATLYGAALLFMNVAVDEPLGPNGRLILGGSVAAITALVLSMAAQRKAKQFKDEGAAKIAARLDGRLLPPSPSAPNEQTLQNVTEEMAVAAGLPAPWVYVLHDEPGINALTAGHGPRDAAIIVTGGALTALDRQELQALIAHEMSHLLHGDTRLNMRMLAILDGLSDVARAGRWLLFWPVIVPRTDHGSIFAVLLVLVVLLIAMMAYSVAATVILTATVLLPVLGILGGTVASIAGLGYLFSRLVQRTLTRQREFLADAAAVQYTRNPRGLATLFQKIEHAQVGSRIFASAANVDHFFFAPSRRSLYFTDLLASHPPLSERMDRLPEEAVTAAHIQPLAEAADDTVSVETEAPMSRVGNPADAHLRRSHEILEQLPAPLYELAHQPTGAQALVAGLLLDTDEEVQKNQRRTIRELAPSGVCKTLQHIQGDLLALPPALRLPLVELAFASLRHLAKSQKKQLHQLVKNLIHANRRASLFEFSLYKLLEHWLIPSSRKHGQHLIGRQVMKPDVRILLSSLAHVGHDTERGAQNAFRTGCALLTNGHSMTLLPRSEINYENLSDAMDRLQRAGDSQHRDIVDAAVRCTLADEHVTTKEAALTRIISVLFDCPLPPFSPNTLSAF